MSTLLLLLLVCGTLGFGEQEDLLGRYEVLRSDDFELGISKTYTLFRDVRSNKTYNVHPSSTQGFSNIRSGTAVRVRGSLVDKHESAGLVTHGDIHVLEYQVLSNPPTQNNTGMIFRRLVMILVNLGKLNLECTQASMKDLLNGADGWYSGIIGLTERNTGGVITYSNDLFGDESIDVYGPYTVPYDGTCDAEAWANAALDAARAQGVDISAYQHRVFALPGVDDIYSTCKWHGLGYVGCDVCNAWVADCTTVEVFLHELGHNLGLPHAGSNWNEGGNLVEYGDPTSVMGNEWWVTNKDVTWYNLPEMDYLMRGAINVVKVTESGDYQIAGFDIFPLNVNHPQGIKVLHPDNGHLFYFSFHANETVYFANQIVVHEYISQNTACYIIRTLPLGQIFTDKLNRITVSPVSFDGTTYTLRVSYGCVVVPTYYQLVMHTKSGNYDVINMEDALPYVEGEIASFTLQIYNMDSPLCTPTTYNFFTKSSPDWLVSFSPSSLYLMPGQNCSIAISVRIPSATTTGIYPIHVIGAASSGFLPSDHDIPHKFKRGANFFDKYSHISFVINPTLGHIECFRHPPTLDLSIGGAQGTSLTYKLQIGNQDGFGCEPTDFVVAVTLPIGLSWDYKGRAVSLAPGHTEEVPLVFSLHDDVLNKDLVVNVTSSSHAVITIYADLPPLSVSRCEPHAPLIQVIDQDLQMETRAADSVLVSVTNRDSIACEASDFQFSVLDEPSLQFARISIYPTYMSLLPGQVGYFYMMVAIPIYRTQSNFSIPVGAERMLEGNYFDSTSYLTLYVTPPPCVLSTLGAYSWCQNDNDLADGLMQCAGLIEDHDSWSCPNINLRVHALLPPGWKIEFLQGEIMQYNPGNSTWFWVNMTVPPNLTPGNYQFSFYGGEVYDEQLHGFNTTYTLHTCTKRPLQISPTSPSPPLVSLGQTVTTQITVTNANSLFCEGLLVLLAAETGKEMKGLVTVGFSRSTFTLSYETNTVIDVTFTTNRTGILPLNSSDTTRTFTFNLTATANDNATFYMAKASVNLTVNLNCTLNPPLVLLTPIDNEVLIPGDDAEGTYTLSVTNTDSPLCSPTHFVASFYATASFVPPGNVDAYLAPNETYVTNITFGVVDNTPPSLYNLTVSVGDDPSVIHAAIAISKLSSATAHFELVSVAVYSFPPHENSCILNKNKSDYLSYRDGIKIGTSSGSNYTDLDRPAGSSNNYTAITIDKRGVRAPTTTTCIASVEVSVLPPDLTKLYFFICLVLASAVWIFGCSVLLLMFRKSLQDKILRSPPDGEMALLLSSEHGDIREGNEEEEEEEEEGEMESGHRGWTEDDGRMSSDEELEGR